ncbi:MAG: uroporphyrinogen-III synthase [Gammaproteobacteria bacterium]|tara:strand:+ start:735 stop:1373 length:639 start_codon:yes stop_codon:yes gene_type:complete
MNIIDTSTNFLSKSGINNIPLFAINKIEHADLSSGKEVVIFQSPSAVKNYSFLEKLANKKIIAMGPGTQKTLQEKSLDSAMPENYNSAGIIQYLKSNFNANNVLIIKGEDGVNDIEEYIARNGGDVESISVYRRNVFEDYTEIENDYLNADAIIFTSTMAVKIYFEKIYQNRVLTRFYSISNRIKSQIQEYGLEAITLDYFSDNLLEEIKST